MSARGVSSLRIGIDADPVLPSRQAFTIRTGAGMQTNLRPMSLGEILDRTAQLYRTNFTLFAGIAAVYAGVLLLLNLLQIGMNEILHHLHMVKQLPWVTLGFVVLILPLVFIFAGAAVAANNRAVSWVTLGEPATIRGAYLNILPRIGRYLWLMTMIGFIIYVPFVVIFLGYSVFLFLYAKPRGIFVHNGTTNPQTTTVVILATLIFFLVAAIAFAYAIYMALRYSLSLAASVLEDLPARKALRRSVELTKGSRGRIFILGVLISVIQVGLVAVTQIFFLVAAFKKHGELPVWAQIAQQVVGFVTNSFIGPMYATGLTLFYYDQRVRKEGYDIEWMMEAAGMNAPVPLQEPESRASIEPTQHVQSPAFTTTETVHPVPEEPIDKGLNE
jgi:uncharacterized membrane protein